MSAAFPGHPSDAHLLSRVVVEFRFDPEYEEGPVTE